MGLTKRRAAGLNSWKSDKFFILSYLYILQKPGQLTTQYSRLQGAAPPCRRKHSFLIAQHVVPWTARLLHWPEEID